MALQNTSTNGDTCFLDPMMMARLPNLEWVARFVVQGFLIGLHKSPYHGFSTEFNSYRKYTKGDSFKFIDWKLVGRTDRIYIKQFEERTNTRCQILLDTSGSMLFGGDGALLKGEGVSKGIQKWLYARSLAAALAYLMVQQSDAVGLALYNNGLETLLPARSSRVHLHQIYSVLEKASPRQGTDTEKGLAGLAERFPSRGLVVLISDLLDDTDRIIAGLKNFRIRRHEMIVFHVLAPEELEFPYRDNIEFVDVESGKIMVTQSSDVAKAYRQSLNEHTEKIRRFCQQNEIDFVPLTTAESLGTALTAYIHRRSGSR